MQLFLKIVSFIIIGLTISCTSLIPVQNLSKEALEGIGKLEEVGYTFKTACIDACTFSKISEFEIEREKNCACDIYERADEQVNNLYWVLMDYWEGLYQLSSMDINQYNLNRPVATLGASNLIQMNDGHLLAFQKLSELSLQAVTGQFRKNKIQSYMQEADAYQQIISEKLAFILKENLLGLMNIQKESWYSFYKAMSYDPTLNMVDKSIAANEYYRLLDKSNSRRDQIQVLIEVILLISTKHNQLVASGSKINSTNFNAEIGQVSKDLRTLHYAFEQLRK